MVWLVSCGNRGCKSFPAQALQAGCKKITLNLRVKYGFLDRPPFRSGSVELRVCRLPSSTKQPPSGLSLESRKQEARQEPHRRRRCRVRFFLDLSAVDSTSLSLWPASGGRGPVFSPTSSSCRLAWTVGPRYHSRPA